MKQLEAELFILPRIFQFEEMIQRRASRFHQRGYENRSRDLALKRLSHFGQLPVKGGLPFEWSAVASNHVAMLGIV